MGTFRDLYRGDNDFDFPTAWKRGLVLSAVLVIVSVGSLLTQGLNLGIDFEGGGVWEVPAAEDVSVADTRDVLTQLGQGNAKIQVVTTANSATTTMRVQAGVDAVEDSSDITQALADLNGVATDDVSVNTVGPSWGDEITSKAQRALVVFFVLIALYITLRLEWKMAVGALIAVAHDIVISVGFYSVFQFEVSPATVIAFLTILGYSLYDTIVVYDKVHENTARFSSSGRVTYTDMMNLSMNQVLMRSINTTFTTIVPVLSMLVIGSLIFGAVSLQEFALALLVGLLSGAYSSIFIAAPTVAWLKEREPRNRAIRERLTGADQAPVAAAVGAVPAAVRASGGGPSTVIPARPRKAKRKRRR